VGDSTLCCSTSAFPCFAVLGKSRPSEFTLDFLISSCVPVLLPFPVIVQDRPFSDADFGAFRALAPARFSYSETRPVLLLLCSAEMHPMQFQLSMTLLWIFSGPLKRFPIFSVLDSQCALFCDFAYLDPLSPPRRLVCSACPLS